ncbi:MAG: hypothetical protein KDE63_11970, partial [Novosphingobium sp.]|nr:hypothetical protein [Novosphingobium sp.]
MIAGKEHISAFARTHRTQVTRLKSAASLAMLVLLTTVGSSQAQTSNCAPQPDCKNHLRGANQDDSTTGTLPVGKNTEIEIAQDDPALPFSISVDGQPLSGTKKPADQKRTTDLALEAVDIQVKFDGLETRTQLNVSTDPIRQAYQAGSEIDFLATSNYWSWIERAQIRIYEAGQEKRGLPVHTIPIAHDGTAKWVMPNDGPRKLSYVLRVYDRKGNYDETVPLQLARTTAIIEQHQPGPLAVAPGQSQDATAVRNIPVFGGVVTVYGRNVPDRNHVVVLGEPVPVDQTGAFVVQRILPPGDHQVSVEVNDQSGHGLEFNRDINIPSNEWFYVGLADLTVGHRFADKGIEAVKPGEYDSLYSKGRLAFYLKGKVKGSTLITASADTGEDDVRDILKGLDSKDPRQFLRRIDPDRYYPVYGDDSTAIEDAPTRGKFYVRIERGDSHAMWGNFKTRITGTQFLRNERALYGASAVYRSTQASPNRDERNTEASLYAAQPGTLPQHDVLRGTGGSVYFLKYQDITIGSETVAIETRDRITGQVINRQVLQYGEDYTINYTQGIVSLTRPLSSTAAEGGVVRSDTLGGSHLNLAVSYEYTPAASNVGGYVYGGRAQQWLGSHMRVGVTGMNEKTGSADQLLYGADVRLQRSQNTYVEAEIARSQGPGFGSSYSTDGGLTIDDIPTAGTKSRKADAYRLNARGDLGELTDGAIKGDLEVSYEHLQSGFSSLDQQVTANKDSLLAKGNVKLTSALTLGGSYSDLRIA